MFFSWGFITLFEGGLIMRYLLSLLVFCAFLPFFSAAEELEGEAEKFEVLGSHIKKTSMEGPSPVLVIDREQIEMSGYNSLADVLRDLPVASFGGQRESSLEDPSKVSIGNIGLRGMKSNDILVLINGRRMSPVGGSNTVNMNILPISSIERVEILKDGASSIYGSDAIGGVINVVTKKDYVGGQVNIQGSLVQREEGNSLSGISSFVDFWNWNDEKEENAWAGKGDKLSIDASYGGNTDDINYLVGGQLRFNSPMYLRDRKFGRPALAHQSTLGSPGSWNDDSGWNPDKNCKKEKVQKGQCMFDYSPYMQFTPQILQGSMFAQANTEMGESNVMATAIYSFTRAFSILAPPPDWLITPNQAEDIGTEKDRRISQTTAQEWGLSPAGPIELKYRLVNETGSGPRHSVENIHYYQFQGGINTPLMDTTEFDAYFNISGSHSFSTGVAGWANRKKLKELANKNPSEFNPFLPDDKKNDVTEAIYKPVTNTHSNLLSIEPQLSGEVMSTNDHTMAFAVGSLGAWQRYDQSSDEVTRAGDQWGGGGNSEGEGSRWYGSLYGELSLLSFEMVELQLAARTDYYNDFGLTKQVMPFTDDVNMPFSPRAALSFQPLDELKLRTSWSMGFKAPTLESIHLKELITYPFGLDSVKCEKLDKTKPGCAITQFKTVLRGNPDLQPELSESFNIGIVIEPVENIFFSVDYFRNNQSEIIIETSSSSAADRLLGDVLAYEKKYGQDKLKEINATVSRDSEGKLKSLEVSPSNQASYKVHGIDLEMGFSIPLEMSWDLGIKLDHSHLLYVERQAFKKLNPTTPIPYYEWMENLFGVENAVSDLKTRATEYKYPRWRNRAAFNLMNKDTGHNFQLVVHNIPGQLKNVQSDESTDHYWQLDLAGSFALSKKTTLTVGIKNILDNERPINDEKFGSSGYVPASLYNIRGRTLDARLTHNF